MRKSVKILCFILLVGLLPMHALADGDAYTFSIDGFEYYFGHGYISEEFAVSDNSVLGVCSYKGAALVDVNSVSIPDGLKVSEIMQATELSSFFDWNPHKDEFIPIDENYSTLYLYDSNNKVNVCASKDGAEQMNILFEEQEPIITADTTLLPIRSIAEFYGWDVAWDGDMREIGITDGTKTVKIFVDKNYMYIGDKFVNIDVPSMILNDRTLVPVRAVSEALGLNVEWIGETNTVALSN